MVSEEVLSLSNENKIKIKIKIVIFQIGVLCRRSFYVAGYFVIGVFVAEDFVFGEFIKIPTQARATVESRSTWKIADIIFVVSGLGILQLRNSD